LRVKLDADGKLYWTAENQSKPVRSETEPMPPARSDSKLDWSGYCLLRTSLGWEAARCVHPFRHWPTLVVA